MARSSEVPSENPIHTISHVLWRQRLSIGGTVALAAAAVTAAAWVDVGRHRPYAAAFAAACTVALLCGKFRSILNREAFERREKQNVINTSLPVLLWAGLVCLVNGIVVATIGTALVEPILPSIFTGPPLLSLPVAAVLAVSVMACAIPLRSLSVSTPNLYLHTRRLLSAGSLAVLATAALAEHLKTESRLNLMVSSFLLVASVIALPLGATLIDTAFRSAVTQGRRLNRAAAILFSFTWTALIAFLLFGSNDVVSDLPVVGPVSIVPGAMFAIVRVTRQRSRGVRHSRRHNTDISDREATADELRSFLVDLLVAQELCLAILRRHAPLISIGLPLTILWWPKTMAGFEFWYAALMAWLVPLVLDLMFLEQTLTHAYEIRMRLVVDSLRDHILILGHGDLGQRVARDLIEQGVRPYTFEWEHEVDAPMAVLPDGRLVIVLKQIAAVDRDPSMLAAVAKCAPGIEVGAFLITDIVKAPNLTNTTASEWPIEFALPQVVGDAASQDVQDAAAMPEAAFVACTLRGGENNEQAHAVVERLERLAGRRIRVPTVLALHSAAYLPLVADRALRHDLPLHTVLTSQLEGLNVAVRVQAAHQARVIDKALRNSDRQEGTRVVAFGRGAKITHFVDSLVKGALDEDTVSAPTTTPKVTPTSRAAHLSSADRFQLVVVTPDERVADVVAEHSVKLHWFGPLISRIPNGKHSLSKGLNVLVDRQNPVGNRVVSEFLRDYRPDIVVILDFEAETEFRLLNYVSAYLYRTQTENPGSGKLTQPLVFVSGETGKPHLQGYFERTMAYLAGIHTLEGVNRGWPGQGIDRTSGIGVMPRGAPFVDILEDSSQRIVALAWAYLTPLKSTPKSADRSITPDNGGRDMSLARGTVVELNFCESDVSGALADRLARLAGLKVEANETQSLHQPSLTNLRFARRKQSGQTMFVMKAMARLMRPSGTGSAEATDERNDQASLKNKHDEESNRLSIRWGNRQYRKDRDILVASSLASVAPGYDAGLVGKFVGFDRNPRDLRLQMDKGAVRATATELLAKTRSHLDPVVDQIEHCCGMMTCPVQTHHVCIEARFRQPALETFEAAKRVGRERRANATVRQLLNAREVLTTFFAKPPEAFKESRAESSRSSAARAATEEPLPLAELTVEYWVAEDQDWTARPGVLAKVLALLRLHTLVVDDTVEPKVDVGYLNASECHDGSYGVVSCYGRLLHEPVERQLPSFRIDKVVVTPYVDSKGWKSYAEDLRAHIEKDQAKKDQAEKDRAEKNQVETSWSYEFLTTGGADLMGQRFEVRRRQCDLCNQDLTPVSMPKRLWSKMTSYGGFKKDDAGRPGAGRGDAEKRANGSKNVTQSADKQNSRGSFTGKHQERCSKRHLACDACWQEIDECPVCRSEQLEPVPSEERDPPADSVH